MKISPITPEWALPLLANIRYKGARGGRGSGKSHFFAQEVIVNSAINPNESTVCVREVQQSIKLSSKRLLEAKILSLGVSHLFDITQQEIRHRNGNGIIAFMGLKDHTADSIKSLEGFKRVWVEEAQSISERSLQLLRPTMRSGSELWFSWNPEYEETPVEVLFAEPDDNMIVVTVNWDANPLFPAELQEEMERDKRLYSPQMHSHIWNGTYITGDMGEVFRWNWFKTHDYVAPYAGFEMIVHSWDTAYKAEQHNDPSACTVWGIKGGNAYLLDMINERMEYPALKQAIIAMNGKHPATHILIEDKASGQSLLQEIRASTSMPVIAINPVGDKVTRANACTDVIAEGKVFVANVQNPWLPEYKKQIIRFSNNKELQKKQHDDIVDSTSQFLNWWKASNAWTEQQYKDLYGR